MFNSVEARKFSERLQTLRKSLKGISLDQIDQAFPFLKKYEAVRGGHWLHTEWVDRFTNCKIYPTNFQGTPEFVRKKIPFIIKTFMDEWYGEKLTAVEEMIDGSLSAIVQSIDGNSIYYLDFHPGKIEEAATNSPSNHPLFLMEACIRFLNDIFDIEDESESGYRYLYEVIGDKIIMVTASVEDLKNLNCEWPCLSIKDKYYGFSITES